MNYCNSTVSDAVGGIYFLSYYIRTVLGFGHLQNKSYCLSDRCCCRGRRGEEGGGGQYIETIALSMENDGDACASGLKVSADNS